MKKGFPVKILYIGVVVLGIAAFLYPFWLPEQSLSAQAHGTDAPLAAGAIGLLIVSVIILEMQRGSMNAATVALLGVLSAIAGLLRLLDLPGGGSGVFFLIILAGAAFGSRFGLLLGICAMAVSAVITGGIGPWLPFQMLALGWMGAGAGFIPKKLSIGKRVIALVIYAWIWGFLYGAIMNLWFWPYAIGDGPLAWNPSLSIQETLQHYWSFYVATSMVWDAAGAFANAVVIALTGTALLSAMSRFSARLNPDVKFQPVAADRG